MADTKTTDETTKTPLVGTELVRLATAGANWKTTTLAIAALSAANPSGTNLSFQYNNSGAFNGGSPGLGFVDANTIEQRNGLNAQTFHQYVTYTDPSNYERLDYATDANGISLSYGALGTGVPRAITVQGGGIFPGSIVSWPDGHDPIISFIKQNVDVYWNIRDGVTGTASLSGPVFCVGSAAFTGATVCGHPTGTAVFDIVGAGISNANPGQLRLNNNGDIQFIKSNVAITWTVSGTSPYHISAATDAISDIGIVGNRPRDLRVSRDIYSGNASFMHRTTTALSNGAAGNTGTLTNAPAVGNPTKWIPIDDNGTTRYVPAW